MILDAILLILAEIALAQQGHVAIRAQIGLLILSLAMNQF